MSADGRILTEDLTGDYSSMEKLKVFIADDDLNFHRLYAFALKGDRYEVRLVENGESALALYDSWGPDIILLDMIMPVMTGYNALKAIRERERETGKHTTVIMVTAMTDRDGVKECAPLGIEGYIVKPFDFRELPA